MKKTRRSASVDPSGRRNRRIKIATLVAAIGAVVLTIALVRPPRETPIAQTNTGTRPAPDPTWTGRLDPPQILPPGVKMFPDTPEFKAEFNRRKAEVTKEALKNVEEWIKYPLWGGRLIDSMVYKKPVPFRNRIAGPGDSDPSVELWPEKLNYAPGEPIRIHAVFRNKSGGTHYDSLIAKTIGGTRPRPEIPLDFQDQGQGDYLAILNVPTDVAIKNRGEWGIWLDCYIDGEHRVGTNDFRIMATDAVITGPYRAAIEDGSLAVYVGIKAQRESRQHLRGELWSAKNEPIAYAWVREDRTQPGSSTMRLLFYGKVIRDSGIDGPYVIRNLLLTTFDDNDDRIENPVVELNMLTDAYAHTMFTDRSINQDNEVLNEKKKILQQELANAEQGLYDPNNIQPPLPTQSSKDVPPPQ